MKRHLYLALAGLLLMASAFTVAQPLQGRERGRTFLTLKGQVTMVEIARDDAQQEWIVAVLKPDGDVPEIRIRVAPPDVLAAQEFPLEPGQRMKVRVFSDESPYVAQQIRNEKTGRVLRLRSLRAEPLWDSSHHHGRGPGREPGHHGQRPNRERSGR